MAGEQVIASYLSGDSRWFVQECHAFSDGLASALQLPFQISMGKSHPERIMKDSWAAGGCRVGTVSVVGNSCGVQRVV